MRVDLPHRPSARRRDDLGAFCTDSLTQPTGIKPPSANFTRASGTTSPDSVVQPLCVQGRDSSSTLRSPPIQEAARRSAGLWTHAGCDWWNHGQRLIHQSRRRDCRLRCRHWLRRCGGYHKRCHWSWRVHKCRRWNCRRHGGKHQCCVRQCCHACSSTVHDVPVSRSRFLSARTIRNLRSGCTPENLSPSVSASLVGTSFIGRIWVQHRFRDTCPSLLQRGRTPHLAQRTITLAYPHHCSVWQQAATMWSAPFFTLKSASGLPLA